MFLTHLQKTRESRGWVLASAFSMFRPVLVVMLALAGSAHAQWLDSGGHFLITGGGALRDYSQLDSGTLRLRVVGPSPSNAHLSAAYTVNSLLGVGFEGRGELMYAVKRDASGAVTTDSPNLPLHAFDLTPLLSVRWRPGRAFGLEGQVGPHLSMRSGLSSFGTESQRLLFGPMLGAVATLSPSRAFGVQAWVRVTPANAGFPTFVSSSVHATFGAQASLGALQVGSMQLGIAATVEAAYSGATFIVSRFSDAQSLVVAQQSSLRFGIGLSVLKFVPELDVPRPGGLQPLAGRVESAQGQPVANAQVQLDGRERATTDASGQFSFASVAEGPHRLTAELDGVAPGALELSVPATAAVVLRLGGPNGPGTISGVVKSNDVPVVGATVTAVDANVSFTTGGDGAFSLAKVGPGPVTVRVTAAEYKDAEEIAQVQPGGTATVDFVLLAKSASTKATFRGLVRSKSGEPVKATVRIVELKQKLAVKPDGRFTAEVPSGKYTLIIEAKGYVTQTKTVEVSEGDQAIFHTELERSR